MQGAGICLFAPGRRALRTQVSLAANTRQNVNPRMEPGRKKSTTKVIFPIMARQSKGCYAKLQGLKAKAHDSQLPNEAALLFASLSSFSKKRMQRENKEAAIRRPE